MLKEDAARYSCTSVKARLRLIIKTQDGYFEYQSVRYALIIFINSCVEKKIIHLLVLFLFKLFDGQSFWATQYINPGGITYNFQN